MNNPYYSDNEPFPSWAATSGSYIADSDLDASGQVPAGPWNLDQICNFNESHSRYRTSESLFGEFHPSAPRRVSVPWPRMWTSNLLPQWQARSRRAQRSSYPAVSSPAIAPTSYPHWTPPQPNIINDFELSVDDSDPLWLDSISTVEEDSPVVISPVETPNRPIPRAPSVTQGSYACRTGGRRRSSGPRLLQCTIHDAQGNRCTKLLSWDDTFRRHERRHIQSTVWPCFECRGKEFLSCAELQRHYNNTLIHNGRDHPEPKSVEKGIIPETLLFCPVKDCSYSSKRFRNLAERQDHLLHKHQEYVYRAAQPSQSLFNEAQSVTPPMYEGFESSPSTIYGNSPFSDRPLDSQRRRSRADSTTSTISSMTNYSAGECSVSGSPAANVWPQTYQTSDFQPFYRHSGYAHWPSIPDVYGGAGYGSSQPDACDFSSHAQHSSRSNGPHPTASAHPLPILLSSMHSGSIHSELDLHGLDPRRISSESTRVTVDTAMAELAHVIHGTSPSCAAGSRASSPDTDDDLDRSRTRKRSGAVRQLQRIYGGSAADQRPSRQSFLERVLPGRQAGATRTGEAANADSRHVDRERGDMWTLVSRPHGDGPWDGLRRC